MVDIHQIRLISLFRHFPDYFHFHGSAGLIPKVNLSLRLRQICDAECSGLMLRVELGLNIKFPFLEILHHRTDEQRNGYLVKL